MFIIEIENFQKIKKSGNISFMLTTVISLQRIDWKIVEVIAKTRNKNGNR